ncbi:LamG-like jellyroll fold domain-containing protein [Spongiimicrobium salis]|uniref:LamG-like jellyroll fold domain-containing protein n=1 Tax=Spongiimicrobium salis TaxID=1667022 RepID=UPI00374D7FEC
MITTSIRKTFLCLSLCGAALFTSCKETKKEAPEAKETTENQTHVALMEALTLYASFDTGVDADFALGDEKLYTVPNRRARDSAQAGLHKPDISIATGEGLFGDALKYTERSPGNIYYPSTKNIAYDTKDWSGAISFWLNLDPATDLEPGYCDPIQITDVSYNDAAIWVDFTKENPRDFRLGVIGDREVWNPNPEGPDNENSSFIEQLAPVKNPPFGKGEWTHILINFSHLNTANGTASLYMNGELKGTRSNISDPFTWELDQSNIYLGLGYIGLMDELSIYNRDLTEAEIEALYGLENGVHTLMKL